MTKERKTYRKKKRQRYGTGTVLVLAVVLVFAMVMGFRMKSLVSTYHRYEVRYAAQQAEYAAEEKRSAELKELQGREQSDEDVEKIARERLGLIKPGEILLRPDK